MTILGASILKNLVSKYKVTYPSDLRAFYSEGYVLTVREDRTLNFLGHRNMISLEIVFTPKTASPT